MPPWALADLTGGGDVRGVCRFLGSSPDPDPGSVIADGGAASPPGLVAVTADEAPGAGGCAVDVVWFLRFPSCSCFDGVDWSCSITAVTWALP